MNASGEGVRPMVAMLEIACLIAYVVAGLWMFSGTNNVPVSPEVGSRTRSV
jgi:hypothetical protein